LQIIIDGQKRENEEMLSYRSLCKDLEARAEHANTLQDKLSTLEMERNAEVEKLQLIIDVQKRESEEMMSSFESYRSKCDTLTKDVDELQLKYTESQRQLETSVDELENDRKKLKFLESRAEIVSELESRLFSLQNDKCASCDKLAVQNEFADTHIRELESQIQEATVKEGNYVASARASDDLIRDLRQSLDEMSQKCNQLSAAASEAGKADAKTQALNGQLLK
jgi:chromosome segregation ATPase